MRSKSGGPRGLSEVSEGRRTAKADAARAGSSRRSSCFPYSPQYQTIISQGHERPPPSFGAPTLVWHVGIWPRRATDEGEPCDPHDTAGSQHGKAKSAFEARRKAWVEQIRDFVRQLREHGSHPRYDTPLGVPRDVDLVAPHDLDWEAAAGEDDFFRPMDVLDPGITPFTIWWRDASEPDRATGRAHAIRICVHLEINADYACLSLYMDIGQVWNELHSADPAIAKGRRRRRLLEAVRDVRSICEHQMTSAPPAGRAPVDLPLLPENLTRPDGSSPEVLHQALLDARNLLYVDIWETFSAETGCGLANIAGARGEVFANFRGLIMPTAGLPQASAYEPAPDEAGSTGTAVFPSFSADPGFAADGAEANAVVKAFWPFVRRVTPRADYREFIACGVLNWRALYITALGSSSHYVEGQERPATYVEHGEAPIRVPDALLSDSERGKAAPSPDGYFDGMVGQRAARQGNNHPVRYLLLTKHAPHPRQIGRIAERINTMGTMRLYALKDWSAIRNADAYIRILGQELDLLTKSWGTSRRLVNDLATLKMIRAFKSEVARFRSQGSAFLPHRSTPKWTGERLAPFVDAIRGYTPKRAISLVVWLILRVWFIGRSHTLHELIGGMENDAVADARHSMLYEVSNGVETNLIDISAKLDELGFGAIGGLHFRLNRSAYYVSEFKILLETLQARNIPSWVSYEQFVRRGLTPAFDYAASVGRRLGAVRARLLTITEMIETSALVGQSAATRHNTAVLRNTTRLAIIFLVLYLASSPLVKVAAFAWAAFKTRLPVWVEPYALQLQQMFQ